MATLVIGLSLCGGVMHATAQTPSVETVPGMPPVTNPTNLYSETTADKLIPALANVPARVYVPNVKSHEVHVIDPVTMTVIDRYKVGRNPQHVVPSWDLKTLWVTNNAEGRTDGTLTPIDPMTGKPGNEIAVDDPYNMYFTPDGKSAVVVAEAMKRLDFRDPKTLALQGSVSAPKCGGINHGDFSIDGKYLIMTCEYASRMVKIDWRARTVLGYLTLPDRGIPQDVRVSPDGSTFYVADLRALTRDQSRFPLLFEEDCNYGFRRNVWGMRPWGILMAVLGLISAVVLILFMPHARPDSAVRLLVVAGMLDFVLILVWIIAVTPSWVKITADAYADQLLAASLLF